MNIEFIKWKIDYADGFEWDEQEGHLFITIPNGLKRTLVFWADFQEWHECYNPLLSQRAIEGVTGEVIIYKYKKLNGTRWNWSYENMRSGDHVKLETPDQAKEAALMYIWEQESSAEGQKYE